MLFRSETQGAVPNVSPGPGNSPPDPNSAIYGKANANQGNVVTIDHFSKARNLRQGMPLQLNKLNLWPKPFTFCNWAVFAIVKTLNNCGLSLRLWALNPKLPWARSTAML